MPINHFTRVGRIYIRQKTSLRIQHYQLFLTDKTRQISPMIHGIETNAESADLGLILRCFLQTISNPLNRSEIFIRKDGVIIRQQSWSLECTQSWVCQLRGGVMSAIKAHADLPRASIVRVLHQFFQNSSTLGIVPEDAADVGRKIYFLPEIISKLAIKSCHGTQRIGILKSKIY